MHAMHSDHVMLIYFTRILRRSELISRRYIVAARAGGCRHKDSNIDSELIERKRIATRWRIRIEAHKTSCLIANPSFFFFFIIILEIITSCQRDI